MKKVFPAITLLFALFAIVAIVVAAGINVGATPALASEGLRAEQTSIVYYCGRSFINETGEFCSVSSSGFNNPLYSSLKFSLDGVEKTVSCDDVRITNRTEIFLPDDYKCELKVNIDGTEYNTEVVLSVTKKPLYVRTKINGESYCVVNEGESYRTAVEYEGFVEGEDESVLDAPAIIQREPKMPTTGFLLVPELAQSSRYEIIYEGATIVINENPDTVRKYKYGDVDALILYGSFSPYYTLEFFDVGLNKSDPKYAVINEKVEKYFSGNRVFEEYKQANAYVINMYLDGDYAEINAPVNVRIRLPENLSGKQYYRIIHFANDGSYEFLNAMETDGYISFSTSDFGEFVLLAPIEGVNTVLIVAICVGICGVVVLAILLFAIFRRKY